MEQQVRMLELNAAQTQKGFGEYQGSLSAKKVAPSVPLKVRQQQSWNKAPCIWGASEKKCILITPIARRTGYKNLGFMLF